MRLCIIIEPVKRRLRKMSENYDRALATTKREASSIADKRIPELYWILREEERKSPEDARAIIERDLIDTWSRATIDKHMPTEAKDEQKIKAGKIGRKKQMDSVRAPRAQITIENTGNQSSATDNQDDLHELHKHIETRNAAMGEAVENSPANDPKRREPIRFTRESVEASANIEKLREQLKAAEIEVNFFKDQLGDGKIIALKGQKHDEIGQFYWARISIVQLRQRLPQLENSGIKFVEIYIKVVD